MTAVTNFWAYLHCDMFTVAESVETAEDAQTLVRMGVDCLQGYYFGAPSIQEPWKVSNLKPRQTG